jgi:hypothetical protein
VCALIRSEFAIDSLRSVDKRTPGLQLPALRRLRRSQRRLATWSSAGAAPVDVDRFGYTSVHLIVQLPAALVRRRHFERFAGLHAEIQVRTVLAHAWAALSHATQYKRETETPLVLGRRFARLAALLELADAELAELMRRHSELQATAVANALRRNSRLPFDMTTLEVFLAVPDLQRELEVLHAAGKRRRRGRGSDRQVTAMRQLFHAGVALGIRSIDQLNGEVMAWRKDRRRLQAFLADRHIAPFVTEPASVVLFALLFRHFGSFKSDWLIERLNWNTAFLRTLAGAVRRTARTASQ